jgi:hypothetical protein
MVPGVLRLPVLCCLLGICHSTIPKIQAQDTTNIYFVVNKTISYYQSNSAPPSLDLPLPFSFFTAAESDDLLVTLQATSVLTPAPLSSDNPIELSPTTTGGSTVLAFQDYLPTQEALSNTYPNGSYQGMFDFSFLGVLNDSTQTDVPLNGEAYPSTPTFLNVENILKVPAGEDLTISWQSFQNGGALDAMGLLVFLVTNVTIPPVFQTNLPASTPAPRVVVPSGLLLPDRTYELELLFDHWNAYRITNYTVAGLFDIELVARSSYSKATRLDIQTTSAPRLHIVSAPNTSPFRFTFGAITGRTYQVQSSPDLQTWATFLTTNATFNRVSIERGWSPTNAPAFFRVLSP